MAEKVCTGDCLKCSYQQQVYCAAQKSHAVMAMMPSVFERLDRIEAALPSGGEVFNPLAVAQSDAGAENKASESQNN